MHPLSMAVGGLGDIDPCWQGSSLSLVSSKADVTLWEREWAIASHRVGAETETTTIRGLGLSFYLGDCHSCMSLIKAHKRRRRRVSLSLAVRLRYGLVRVI